jgi:Peptidase family M28
MNYSKNGLSDKDYALNFARNLSFPRRIGSQGHDKAINYLTSKFAELNLKSEADTFNWTPSKTLKLLFRFSMIVILSFTLLLLLIMSQLIWISLILFTIMIIYSFSLAFRLRVHLLEKQFQQKLQNPSETNEKMKQGSNLFAIHEPEQKVKEIIILSGHFDSINLTMGPKSIIIYSIFTQAGPPLLIIILFPLLFASGIFYTVLQILASILIVLTILGYLLSFTIKYQNRSNGAVDNASGVAVAFGTLNEILKSTPLNHTLLLLATFDAEEEGLIGSTFFVKHTLPPILDKYQLKKSQVHLISFDGPGSKGKLGCNKSFGFPFVVHHNHGIVDRIKIAARNLNIPFMGGIWFFYASSDHATFALNGYDCTWFFSMSTVSNTTKDKIELLDQNTLNNAISITLEYIYSFDKELLSST